jgi:hypothetical protein
MAAADFGFAIETYNYTVTFRSSDLSKVLFFREMSDVETLFNLTNSEILSKVQLKDMKEVKAQIRESSTTSP